MSLESKPVWRSRAKAIRAELDPVQISQAAAPFLAEVLQGAQNILLYSAFAGEPDPTLVRALLPNANFFLPKVAGDQLLIFPSEAQLLAHRYGFLEPAGTGTAFNANSLEAVVVPGLAFDRAGHRLGYGKGFYDRFLAQLNPKVIKVGLVPSQLIFEQLPIDPWDQPVDLLVSEQGVHHLTPNSPTWK